MVTATQVLESDVNQRASLIISEVPNFLSIDDELEKSRALANVINSFISEYIEKKVTQDKALGDQSIMNSEALENALNEEIDSFLPIAIAELKKSQPTAEELIKSSKNIYEMSGAVKLSFANRATRNLSTTMGLLWERLANVSPYAINPELEFSLKIKGIDLIAKNKNTDLIEYQQLKTQHNTLTGSQKTRSVSELMIHENPVFCACFANNSSWTFNHPDIPRVSGTDFWERIGVSYEIVLKCLRRLISKLEEEYVTLLQG